MYSHLKNYSNKKYDLCKNIYADSKNISCFYTLQNARKMI